jgi:hypothetical protein
LNWLIELAKDLATLAHVTKMLATSKIHICNIHTYLYEKKKIVLQMLIELAKDLPAQ